jgi:hypothetical protein
MQAFGVVGVGCQNLLVQTLGFGQRAGLVLPMGGGEQCLDGRRTGPCPGLCALGYRRAAGPGPRPAVFAVHEATGTPSVCPHWDTLGNFMLFG